MALIIVTDHAAKRFRQRKGIDIMNKPKRDLEARALQAVTLMKSHLFNDKPKHVDIEGDRYYLGFNRTVEGEEVCVIRTVLPDAATCSWLKRTFKNKLQRLLNDW
jgi:hypothetical protein